VSDGMSNFDNPISLDEFRRNPWRFQQTFLTPLRYLKPFVETIFSSQKETRNGTIIIDQVVFEPKHLKELLFNRPLPISLEHNWALTVTGRKEIESLLIAALSDWVDFLFIPFPASFVIYADHDEFTTFYANTRANLDVVVDALLAKEFEEVREYTRQFFK
jgi:hypothetical protein